MGGIVAAIEQGFPQREIAEAAYVYQRQVDGGDKIVVGVNRHSEGDVLKAPTLKIGPGVEETQVARLLATRQRRDSGSHARTLERLTRVAGTKENLMPAILDAVRGYASVGEICDAGFEVIYTGLHQTPEMVVATALQEDVDGIGLSLLSGAHNTIFPKILRLLADKSSGDTVVFGGGIIPEEDILALQRAGVRRMFTPGATTQEVVDWVKANVPPRRR